MDDVAFNALVEIVAGNLALAVVSAVVIFDAVLWTTFYKWYYIFGIPLFWLDVHCGQSSVGAPAPAKLVAAFKHPEFRRFEFRAIDSSKYGFREGKWDDIEMPNHWYWGFRSHRRDYLPAMHGLVCFDYDRKRVRIIGFANWWILALIAIWVLILGPDLAPGLVPSLLTDLRFGAKLTTIAVVPWVLGVFSYAIQAKRFSNVAEVAASNW